MHADQRLLVTHEGAKLFMKVSLFEDSDASKSGGKKYVSLDLVCSHWANLGSYRKIGDARTYDDLLDHRARRHRIDLGRRRYSHIFAPDKRTISSRRLDFFHTGRDAGSLHLLQVEDSFSPSRPVLSDLIGKPCVSWLKSIAFAGSEPP